MNRKQKALLYLVVGLLVFLFLKSCFSELVKLPAGSATDASAIMIALLNGGIDVLNVVLSPMLLLMGVPLFLILFTLFKTPKEPKLDQASLQKTTNCNTFKE